MQVHVHVNVYSVEKSQEIRASGVTESKRRLRIEKEVVDRGFAGEELHVNYMYTVDVPIHSLSAAPSLSVSLERAQERHW